jgi:DnaJ-class molecular chaperone
MEISLEESLFGFVKTFEHLDGSDVVVSRSGILTTKDTKHIIKEKGTINKQGYLGNLIVRFKVTIPSFTD